MKQKIIYEGINGKYIQFNFEQMRKFCIEFGFEYVPLAYRLKKW